MDSNSLGPELMRLAENVAEMRGSITAKLDNFITDTTEIKAQMVVDRQFNAEQHKRIALVEARLNLYAGGLAVLVFLVPIAVGIWLNTH